MLVEKKVPVFVWFCVFWITAFGSIFFISFFLEFGFFSSEDDFGNVVTGIVLSITMLIVGTTLIYIVTFYYYKKAEFFITSHKFKWERRILEGLFICSTIFLLIIYPGPFIIIPSFTMAGFFLIYWYFG